MNKYSNSCFSSTAALQPYLFTFLYIFQDEFNERFSLSQSTVKLLAGLALWCYIEISDLITESENNDGSDSEADFLVSVIISSTSPRPGISVLSLSLYLQMEKR